MFLCQARAVEQAKQELIESGQVFESISSSRTTSVASRRGRGRQEDLCEAVVVPHGGVYDRPDSEADEFEYSSLYAGQSPTLGHADIIFGTTQVSATLRQHVSAMVESPYADAGGGAYFDGPTVSGGWRSQRQSVVSVEASSRPALGRSLLSTEGRVEVENEVELWQGEESDGDLEGMRGLFMEE
jgi:hypothetical protein